MAGVSPRVTSATRRPASPFPSPFDRRTARGGVQLETAARRAAQTILERPRGTRWFLAADNDADGICAAGVMAAALRRAGHAFQFRASRQKDADAYRELAGTVCDGVVVLDKGSSHLDVLSDVARRIEGPVVVIDHHGLPAELPDNVTVVNPRGLGLDGSRDASAATTAAAVALQMQDANLDLAGIALAGATGDWQHHGGWQGWNKELLQRAAAAGHLEQRRTPAVVGIDLADALTHTEPPTPGLGEREAAQDFVARLGMESVRDVEELDDEARARLLSAWALQHLAHGSGVEPEALVWPVWHDRRMGLGIRHLFRLMDACGRTGAAPVGFAYILGDAAAGAAVRERFDDYTQRLGDAILHLRQEGTRRMRGCQVAWTDDPAFTGMVGGIGMQHILDPAHGPAVVLAKRPDGDVQVSTRGTHEQVAAGMDLGRAVDRAAKEVGREGGGHPIASGTVVAPGDVDALLEALDRQVFRDLGTAP